MLDSVEFAGLVPESWAEFWAEIVAGSTGRAGRPI
jgi:hypothetical protein